MFRKASTVGALVWSLLLFPLLYIVVLAGCVAIAAMFPTALVVLVFPLSGWPVSRLSGWPIIAIFFAFATPLLVHILVDWLRQARPGRQGSLQRIKDIVREKLWIEAQLAPLQEQVLREEGTRLPWGTLRGYLQSELQSFRKALERLERWGHTGWDEDPTDEELDEHFSRYGLSLAHRKLPWQ